MKRVVVLLSLVVLPAMIFAQISGKLFGVVTSADGTPLAGANVVLEGTTMGAATDEDGRYYILDVPVGTYSVRVDYIGYKTHIVNNIRVSIGLTTDLDFALNVSVVEGEEVVIVYPIEITPEVEEVIVEPIEMTPEVEEVIVEPIEIVPEVEEAPFNLHDYHRSSVDSLLNEMEFGTIAFNTPTNININDSPEIQLILSLAETVEQLKQSITEEGERVGATIRVSDRMEAHLSGYMFQITVITPEIQAVSRSQQTEWKWEIHPKEEGRHKLYLTLTALLEIDGYNTPRAIRTFDKIIEVNVTAIQKARIIFQNYWHWLWVAILAPVIRWLWRIWKRRKKSIANG